jgi:hypothetical protein
MRKVFFTLVFLSAALILPLAAHCDTIDDFVLTGDGHTISYSLPGAISSPDYNLFTSFYASAPTTIDGVSGYTTDGQYFALIEPYSLILSVPSSIFGESELSFGSSPLSFPGPPFIAWSSVPANNPPSYQQDDVIATFIPGTYTFESFADFGYTAFNDPPVFYTLTITQETPAATPEPSSVVLFATGALGILGFAAFNRRRLEL